ncbi:hypothetical protein ACPPVT_10090 [Angustibacter sp. McL0619]|uniref:hypothetical protein n=1 Tax=Angustibacter sp. McL0619 TaxID=3415676 RepID=UPI003CF4F6B3
MGTRSVLRARMPQGDDGIGLLFVITAMMMATLVAFSALGYALNTQRSSRTNQDWNGALAAAQAGVDDYIGYLNRNDNYARNGDDCTNLALKGSRTPANTCSPAWTSTTAAGWKPIEPGDPNGAAFHYDIDSSRLDSTGVVLVTSSGRARPTGPVRTLQVGVGRGGSTQFLYYTDHEDADPDNKAVYPSGMNAGCSKYWWQPTRGRAGSLNCVEITFYGGDVLDGAVHTNDTPLMTNNGSLKPKFLQGLETSDPNCKSAVPGNVATYTNCDRNGNGADYGTKWPVYADPKDLVDNSDQFATFPGCQYKGATRIKFTSDGKMQVWSKESATTAACGGTSPMGTTVNVPTDQVIYVTDGTAGEHMCAGGEIGDGLPLGTYTGAATGNQTYDANMKLATHNCGKGNVYVEGVLKGRVTVAAKNSVIVTGDLVMAGGLAGSDMLGLVATNSVEVYHPVLDTWECQAWNSSHTRCNTWGWDGNTDEVAGWPHRYPDPDHSSAAFPATGVQLTASIQTLQHSFLVQSYKAGTQQGQLYVKGSLAQRWRGIVGQGNSTGYLKNYSYDKRLRYASPPYFPQWTNAVWAANYTGEIQPAY